MAEYIEREAVLMQIGVADFVRDNDFEGGAALLFQDDVVGRVSSIPAADVVSGRDFRDCRNELCLYCGQYKMRHKGACDGCRWMPKEGDA